MSDLNRAQNVVHFFRVVFLGGSRDSIQINIETYILCFIKTSFACGGYSTLCLCAVVLILYLEVRWRHSPTTKQRLCFILHTHTHTHTNDEPQNCHRAFTRHIEKKENPAQSCFIQVAHFIFLLKKFLNCFSKCIHEENPLYINGVC